MKTIHTAPMEVLAEKMPGTFETEPYEVGWAEEALAMIYVRELAATGGEITLRAQISADGARWFDHPAAPLVLKEPGGYSLPLRHFGNWLRLAGKISGSAAAGKPAALLDIYWVLKG